MPSQLVPPTNQPRFLLEVALRPHQGDRFQPTGFPDLGPDWSTRKGDRDRKVKAHLRQLEALGLQVTITPAA